MNLNTYADDLDLLTKHTRIVQISDDQNARIAVAPAYQGRVMTSTLDGGAGASFGWINRSFIENNRQDLAFNNYGGEDRFWLGPEAGQFGLWFKKGEPFDLTHWKTPKEFNTGKFRVTSQGKRSVAMAAIMKVRNYSGTEFSCAVRRVIRALSRERVVELLGSPISTDVKMVAFESSNMLANVGEEDWNPDTGLLSIWIIGQFRPLPTGKVIVPFNPGSGTELGPRATTDYFGPVGPDRCQVKDDHLLFACDGRHRAKSGISPMRSKSVLGSYDPQQNLLTIVHFNLPGGASRLPYVNSLWKIQDQPYAGDVVNTYNDGEETPGAGQLGPFYEIETSSPAARLSVGGDMVHVHRTMHFQGTRQSLRDIALRVLGVDLAEVSK